MWCFRDSGAGYKTAYLLTYLEVERLVVLKEDIAYYTTHGGSVYCSMLDATNAFDRVEYCKLFNGLLRSNLPTVYIRLLLNMYTNHVTRLSWNGICSRPFVVRDGVKQRAVISPILFCIYLDSLLGALQKLRIRVLYWPCVPWRRGLC